MRATPQYEAKKKKSHHISTLALYDSSESLKPKPGLMNGSAGRRVTSGGAESSLMQNSSNGVFYFFETEGIRACGF